MKANVIIVAVFSIAAANATSAIVKEVIQARQVQAGSLRAGTRRLTARQNSPSTTPALSVGRYLDCPDAPGYDFTEENAFIDFVSATETDSTIGCFYTIQDGDAAGPSSVYCTYDGNTGAFVEVDPTTAASICPAPAPISRSTGTLCYTSCNRRSSGDYLRSATFNMQYAGPGGYATICAYGPEQYADYQYTCVYDSADGTFITSRDANNQPFNGPCATTSPSGTYCVNTLAG